MSEACGVGPERSAENSLAGPWGCLAHGHVLATVSRTICSKIQKPPSAPHSGPLARALLPAGFALLAGPSAASRICRAWRLESSFSGYSRSCIKASIPSLSSVMWKLRPALGDVQRGEHPGDCGRGHFLAPTDQGGGKEMLSHLQQSPRSGAEIQAFPVQAGSHGAWPGLEHQRGPRPQRGVRWDWAPGSVRPALGRRGPAVGGFLLLAAAADCGNTAPNMHCHSRSPNPRCCESESREVPGTAAWGRFGDF